MSDENRKYAVPTYRGRVMGVFFYPDLEHGMTHAEATELYERRRREEVEEERASELHRARVDVLRQAGAGEVLRAVGKDMSTSTIITGLIARQIERGFEPVWESDAYREDWRLGRDAGRRGERCPRWQTVAFQAGYRVGKGERA